MKANLMKIESATSTLLVLVSLTTFALAAPKPPKVTASAKCSGISRDAGERPLRLRHQLRW
jgi:hypothetical protein